MVRAPLVLIVAALAVGVFGVGQASSRGAAFQTRVSANQGGPWDDTDTVHLKRGEHVSAWFRVRSLDDEDLQLDFGTVSEPYDDYSVKWFKGKRGNQDISNEVEDASYEFTLPNGGTRYFRARVKRVEDATKETCIDAEANFGMTISYAALGVNTHQCSI